MLRGGRLCRLKLPKYSSSNLSQPPSKWTIILIGCPEILRDTLGSMIGFLDSFRRNPQGAYMQIFRQFYKDAGVTMSCMPNADQASSSVTTPITEICNEMDVSILVEWWKRAANGMRCGWKLEL